MKIYETVTDYLKDMKVGDDIVFEGHGIVDGLKTIDSKHDVFKVYDGSTDSKLTLRKYRGRTNLTMGSHSYGQRVALLTKKEYNALPILY